MSISSRPRYLTFRSIGQDIFGLPTSFRECSAVCGNIHKAYHSLCAGSEFRFLIGIDAPESLIQKWFLLSLKRGYKDAFDLLDFWLCALGLCDGSVPPVLSQKPIPNMLYQDLVVDGIAYFRNKSAPEKGLVEFLIRSALNGDSEAKFYIREALSRVESSGYQLYAAPSLKELLPQLDCNDKGLLAAKIAIEDARKRTGVELDSERGEIERLAQQKEQDRKRTCAEEKRACAEERTKFFETCESIKDEFAALSRKNGNVCFVCKRNAVPVESMQHETYSCSKVTAQNKDWYFNIEVEIPLCESCKKSEADARSAFEKEQNLVEGNKILASRLRDDCRNNTRIVSIALSVLTVLSAALSRSGEFLVAGCLIAGVLYMILAGVLRRNAARSIAKLQLEGVLQKPQGHDIREFEPIQYLISNGFVRGVAHAYEPPSTRF